MTRTINITTSFDSGLNRWLQRCVPLAVGLVLGAGCAMEETIVDDEPDVSAPEIGSEFNTDGEAIATIEVPSGPTLHFIALGDPEIEDVSIGVVETGRVDGYRLEHVPALEAASPREIFHAVTRGKVAEPALMAEIYPQPSLGARGWFLDAIDRGELVADKLASCESGNFEPSFEAWNSHINSGEGYDIEARPASDSNFTESDPFAAGGCAFSGLPCMYEWESTPGSAYTKYNVDRYKTRVRVCDLQFRSTISYQGTWRDVGPVIAFRYRTGGNSSTGTAFSQDLDSTTAEGTYWQWAWSGSPSPQTSNDYDWRTEVDLAWTNDEYSIGYAWKHEGW